MTNDTIMAALAGSTASLVDIEDWAVNVLRDYCRERGYPALRLYEEEVERIKAGGLGLAEYLRVRRTGSHYRLTRVTRRAVWTRYAARRLLNGGS